MVWSRARALHAPVQVFAKIVCVTMAMMVGVLYLATLVTSLTTFHRLLTFRPGTRPGYDTSLSVELQFGEKRSR